MASGEAREGEEEDKEEVIAAAILVLKEVGKQVSVYTPKQTLYFLKLFSWLYSKLNHQCIWLVFSFEGV